MYEIDGNMFEWDEEKHRANIKKHGVDFHEAATAIIEPNAISSFDFEHSHFEERYKILGFSEKSRLLLVSHCQRNEDKVTRIFSARKATKQEHNDYWRSQNERGHYENSNLV